MYTFLNILALGAALASACGPYNDLPQWFCDVCGTRAGTGSDPYPCTPANATFDDISVGPIPSNYKALSWTNFEVVAAASPLLITPFVEPYSAPNYAKLPAGQTGMISGGSSETDTFFFHSFHFACSLPLLETPTSCEIEVVGFCAGFEQYVGSVFSFNATYDHPNPFNETMTFATPSNGFPSSPSSGECLNINITAHSLIGTPVDLYLDSVLLAAYVYVG